MADLRVEGSNRMKVQFLVIFGVTGGSASPLPTSDELHSDVTPPPTAMKPTEASLPTAAHRSATVEWFMY